MGGRKALRLAVLGVMAACMCDAFVGQRGGFLPAGKGGAVARRGLSGTTMQLRQPGGEDGGNGHASRRRALSGAAAAAAAFFVGQQEARADILDVVTGNQRANDVLARLKIGKVYLPTLSCDNSTQACWKSSPDRWYDYPIDWEDYTETPSGVQVKDLPPRAELAELIKTSPIPNAEDGTDNVQIFFAAYVCGGASKEQLKDFYDTSGKNPKSKYFDVTNQDPRLFQMGSLLINVDKSNLLPGLSQGLVGMRCGQRRSIFIPEKLAYGDKGTTAPGFRRSVPPNVNIVINLEIKKIVR